MAERPWIASSALQVDSGMLERPRPELGAEGSAAPEGEGEAGVGGVPVVDALDLDYDEEDGAPRPGSPQEPEHEAEVRRVEGEEGEGEGEEDGEEADEEGPQQQVVAVPPPPAPRVMSEENRKFRESLARPAQDPLASRSAARTLNATGRSRVTLSLRQEHLRAACQPRREERAPEVRPNILAGRGHTDREAKRHVRSPTIK